MIAEALRLLQTTAQQAAEPKTINQSDPRKLLIAINGVIQERDVPPAVRSHRVRSLADLIAYVSNLDDPGHPVVFHYHEAVVLILDDADRRDKVIFSLNFSGPFSALLNLDRDKPALDQAAFIRLMRLELGMPEAAILPFRRFNWQVSETGRSEVGGKKESLDRSTLAELQGTEDLPDEMVVPVPIYSDQGERDEYQVHCAVEYDVRNRTIYLCPLPGEIPAAVDNAQADIRGRLDAELDGKVPVYYGEP